MTPKQKKYFTYAVIAGIGYFVAKENLTSHLPISIPFGHEFRIEAVENGAVDVVEVNTGIPQKIYDESLVEECLKGQLKKGDIINQ